MKRFGYVAGFAVMLASGSAFANVWGTVGQSGTCFTAIAQSWGIGCGTPNAGGLPVYHLVGGTWTQVSNAWASQITTDMRGNPWVTTANHYVYAWNGSSFSQFGDNSLGLVAVAVGDPTLTNEIYAIDSGGDVFVNHGTQSSPGAWGGGNTDTGWTANSQISEPAAGIAVFSSNQTGCGTHEAFVIGSSTNKVYRLGGTGCVTGWEWDATSGFAGGDLINSISHDFVIGTDGSIWKWNATTESFGFYMSAAPGGTRGLGGPSFLYAFDATSGRPWVETVNQ